MSRPRLVVRAGLCRVISGRYYIYRMYMIYMHIDYAYTITLYRHVVDWSGDGHSALSDKSSKFEVAAERGAKLQAKFR